MQRRKDGDMTHGVREAAKFTNDADGQIDARQGMATTVFTVESLGLKSTHGHSNAKRRGKGKGGTYKRAATTVLAGEATYDVERRVRDARRAIGVPPAALLPLSPATFDLTRAAVRLMPNRPKWDYELKRGRLHSRERKAFVRWIASVKQSLIDSGAGHAPAFEQNIEVWRQLWRVLERADVAVLVVDARHPMLHIPPALYAHVARRLRKPLVLVLNKVDAVPRRAAERWAAHLLAALPGVDDVIGFTSKDGGGGAGGQRPVKRRIGVPALGARGAGAEAVTARERVARAMEIERGGLAFAGGSDSESGSEAEEDGGARASASGSEGEESEDEAVSGGSFRLRIGHAALLKACRELAANGKRNGADARTAAEEAAAAAAEEAAEELEAKASVVKNDDEDEDEDDEATAAALQAEAEEAAKAKENRVMIGLVGHPNVGKSSMVNYILGRKAVSVKATPGHTKTLQTLILDDKTCLCDSPGLVFPRLDVGLAEQIVGGLVPLPIVREPYSAIRWLAELRNAGEARWTATANDGRASRQDNLMASALAMPLHKALKIPAMTEYDPEVLELVGHEDLFDAALPWSPMSLCHQYGKLRGFSRGGAPDEAAAGHAILSLVLDGRLPYATPPPEGEPVIGVHIGADGLPVAAAERAGSVPAVADAVDDEDEDEEDEDDEDDDDEDGAAINPFRLLGIDAEGESQYGTGDIDAENGVGRFKVKDKSKGAAASFFGRGGGGDGGSVFLSEADLKESKKGKREKKGR